MEKICSFRCLNPSFDSDVDNSLAERFASGVTLAPGLHYNRESENDKTFIITANTTELELTEWLQDNKPSNHYDRTAWFHLYWENSIDQDEVKEARAKQLWTEATDRTYNSVIDIAKKTGYLEGKWFFTSNRVNVNQVWKAVAIGILNKEFGPDILHATVDCRRPGIRVYTKDFTCRDQIFGCEEKLRNYGMKGRMFYRPNIFSLLRIKNDVIPSWVGRAVQYRIHHGWTRRKIHQYSSTLRNFKN